MSVKELRIPGKTNPVGIAQNIDGSKYFTWGEALHELSRTPADFRVTQRIIQLAQRLDIVREAIGQPIIVQSWYRTPAINRAVGGVDGSRHTFGDAVDWHPQGGSIRAVREYLEREWKGGLGFYGDWFHTDLGRFARW